MEHVAVAALVLAALRGEVPPEPTAALHARSFPWAVETSEERDARYVAFAEDVAAAVAASAEPVAGRPRLAALLVSVALRESALAPDVDRQDGGACAPERVRGQGAARGQTCDGGRARSAWQLQNFVGATRADFARETIRAIGRSRNTCARAGLPPAERLAAFAAGSRFMTQKARDISRDREAYADRILARYRVVEAAK